jgi:formylglycine-generating enzyme required for sulfatase activity
MNELVLAARRKQNPVPIPMLDALAAFSRRLACLDVAPTGLGSRSDPGSPKERRRPEACARWSSRSRLAMIVLGMGVLAVDAVCAQRNPGEGAGSGAIAASASPAEAERAAAAKVHEEFLAHIAIAKAWVAETIGVELVPIRGGSFRMGSEQGHRDERPLTQVTLRDFALGKTELTQAQWQAVMRSNPSRFRGTDRPVENVSWDMAMLFCRRLTDRARAAGKLPAGFEFTLPTEAQWEYACRAGDTGDYAADPGAMAWYDANSDLQTHPVGIKQANAWGLHDMHGNVLEWCHDWFQDSLPGGRVTEPTGPAEGSFRIYRGGGWSGDAGNLRYSHRFKIAPDDLYDGLGFRLALRRIP